MRWISRISIPVIIIIAAWYSSNIQWGGENWKGIIEADAKGYYAYLPALFIYHDLHFNFFDTIEKKYYNPNTYYDYRTSHKGQTINKYFAGTALAQLPFFLAAHALAHFMDYPADGYSKLYPVFINIAALFYLFTGLIYTCNFLRSFQAGDNLIAFLLFTLVFGTNLFYYSTAEPGMPHVYSFAFIAMFTYYVRKYFLAFHPKNIFYCALLLGVIILIRPVNGMIVFSIPFIAGSLEKIKEGWQSLGASKWVMAIALIACIGICWLQLFIYYIQSGDYFVYSYGEERFNWMHPHMIDFLFSYKKGVFVYAPLLLFALPGFFYLWKKDRFRFWALLLFSFLLIYVFSSWWNWWYGGSFGSRVMIDFYVFDALLLAFAYKLFEKRLLKIIYTVLLVLPTLLCIAQTYQYRYLIIHWENMDREKYWKVFLKFDTE